MATIIETLRKIAIRFLVAFGWALQLLVPKATTTSIKGMLNLDSLLGCRLLWPLTQVLARDVELTLQLP